MAEPSPPSSGVELLAALQPTRLLAAEGLQAANAQLAQAPDLSETALARFLVERRMLTRYQAKVALGGSAADLVLGPYAIQDVIGQGSLGPVYRAVSTADQKPHVIKILAKSDAASVAVARTLIRTVSGVAHPGLTYLTHVGTVKGRNYFVYPFIAGESLEGLVKRAGPVPEAQARSIGADVAEALNEFHKHGYAHGLVKPGNVMIDPNGRVHLLDVGMGTVLANDVGQTVLDTMSLSLLTTSNIDCCAPEVLMETGKPTPGGDQYSLGCTIYYALTGRLPFENATLMTKILSHQSKVPESPEKVTPQVSPEMARVVAKLMEKEPAKRYPSARHAALALKGFLNESPSTPIAENVEPSAPPVAAKSGSSVVPLTIVGLVVAAVVAAAYFALR